jgi:hypothetical protein
MNIIGKNRKYLLNIFNRRAQKEVITYDIAKNMIIQILRSVGIVVDDSCYVKLIKFAEKDGIIDYKFMLEVYKERIGRLY